MIGTAHRGRKLQVSKRGVRGIQIGAEHLLILGYRSPPVGCKGGGLE